MIVDSSAVLAVIRREPEAWTMHRALIGAVRARMSAANFLETAIAVDGARDPVASHELDRYVRDMDIEVVSLTPGQARVARAAYRDFGRGSGHPAKLNFGDCFAYALAKDLDEPLLYKGDDFGHTDVRRAV